MHDNSIQKGQLEAAHALGYTEIQKFFHIIVPRDWLSSSPNLGARCSRLFGRQLLYITLGIFDILGKARQRDTNVSHVKTFEMYFSVAIIYWALAVLIQFIFSRLGKTDEKGKCTMNFSWAFIFDTTGYVVKALPLTLFLTISSGDGRPGAGLSLLDAAENVSGSGGESSWYPFTFLFPEHSTSGAAFSWLFNGIPKLINFYLLRWGTCLGFH